MMKILPSKIMEMMKSNLVHKIKEMKMSNLIHKIKEMMKSNLIHKIKEININLKMKKRFTMTTEDQNDLKHFILTNCFICIFNQNTTLN